MLDEFTRRRVRSMKADEWTVETMLEALLDSIRTGDTVANKAVVLLVDDEGEYISINRWFAGTSTLEARGVLLTGILRGALDDQG